MTTVCCICHRTKKNKNWVKRLSLREQPLSHGYCPDCFSRFIEEIKSYSSNIVSGSLFGNKR